MQKLSIRNSILAISLVSAMSFSGQASASQCKGLESNDCGSNASCSWVEGYERKDGRTVKSFCRTKPASKQKAGLSQAKKVANAKTTSKAVK